MQPVRLGHVQGPSTLGCQVSGGVSLGRKGYKVRLARWGPAKHPAPRDTYDPLHCKLLKESSIYFSKNKFVI